MIREHGNMWSIFGSTDYFIVTTNSYVRGNGQLVMGRGAAFQLKRHFPELPAVAGRVILHLGIYGMIWLLRPREVIGLFQVKKHFKDNARIDLIVMATNILRAKARDCPEKRFDMNFPGIGNGHLKESDVLPIIEVLPDNVHIWTYA